MHCGVDGSYEGGPRWMGIFKLQRALSQVIRQNEQPQYQAGLRRGIQAQA